MKVYVTKAQHDFWLGMSYREHEEWYLCGCVREPVKLRSAFYRDDSRLNVVSVPDSDPRLGTFEV